MTSMRPTLSELAEARRKAQWFIATTPDHSMVDTLRTFLAMTTPVTKEEAIPVMVEHANSIGGWNAGNDDRFIAEC